MVRLSLSQINLLFDFILFVPSLCYVDIGTDCLCVVVYSIYIYDGEHINNMNNMWLCVVVVSVCEMCSDSQSSNSSTNDAQNVSPSSNGSRSYLEEELKYWKHQQQKSYHKSFQILNHESWIISHHMNHRKDRIAYYLQIIWKNTKHLRMLKTCMRRRSSMSTF